MSKRIIKYLSLALASLIGLVVLVLALLYVPPVQRSAVRWACNAFSDDTMRITVGDFRLRFPLTLDIADAAIVQAGDTMCAVGAFHTEVSIPPLIRLQAVVPELSLRRVVFNMSDSTGFTFGVRAEEASLLQVSARLRTEEAEVALLRLSGGSVFMRTGVSATTAPEPADTTTTSEPLDWKLGITRIELADISYDMQSSYAESYLSTRVEQIGIAHTGVDLGTQFVTVDTLALRGAGVSYIIDTTAVIPISTDTIAPTESDTTALPWTIQASTVRLSDTEVIYGNRNHTPGKGLDTEYIQLYDINIALDSVYNRGADIAVRLSQLSLRERSGLTIRQGNVRFSMNSEAIEADEFSLATNHSRITADVYADAGVMSTDSNAHIAVALDVTAGLADAILYDPSLAEIINKLPFDTLLLDTRLSGTLGDLQLQRLYAEMPHHADILLQGAVQSATAIDSLKARIDLTAHLNRLGFVTGLLGDAVEEQVSIPDSILLQAAVDFSNEQYADAQLNVDLASARLAVDAGYRFPDTAYRAKIDISSFPLSKFLPREALGLLSMSLTAAGEGTDPFSPQMHAQADLCIDTVDYGGYRYNDMCLSAILDKSEITGKIKSDDSAIRLDMDIAGKLSHDEYKAQITGVIDNADLKTARLTDDSITVSTRIDIEAYANTNNEYTLRSRLENLKLHLLDTDASYEYFTATADVLHDSLDARIDMPGLRFSFLSPTGLDTLLARLTTVTDTLQYAIDSMTIAPKALCDNMPYYEMQGEIVPEQLVEKILADNGLKIGSVVLSSAHDDGRPLEFTTEVQEIAMSSMIIDTLSVALRQNDDSVRYAVRVGNRPETSEMLASAGISGYIAPQELLVALRQQNQAGEQSLMLDIDAFLRDSLVHVTLLPEHPTLGMPHWTLNSDNYIDYYFDGRLAANLEMARAPQSLSLQSGAHPGADTIYLDIRNLDVESILQTFPGMPPVKSYLSTYIAADLSGKYPYVDGHITLDSTFYDKGYVGDIALTLNYRQPSATLMQIKSALAVDSVEALSVNASYDTDTLALSPIDASIDIPGIPLRLANAFVDGDMLRLAGMLQGDITVKGRADKPQIDGDIEIIDGAIDVPMIGAKYTLSSPSKMSMHGDMAGIDTFAIMGPNNRPLSIKGKVNLTDIARPYVDASIVGNDFEVFNVKKNKTSMLYGVASADINLSAKGYTDALLLRGNVDLLNGTEATYVLRDNSSLPGVSDYGDMVTFTKFADTTEATTNLPLRKVSGMDMLVNVDIGNAVDLSVELTPDGNSYIDLQGGGSLTYSMNDLGDNRFTGRYELSGGTVCYTPPLIGEKLFSIKEGSAVVWEGDIASPSLDITAIDKLQIGVTSGNSTRNVQFNVSITIAGTLENLSIIFDVAAPGDMAIQNELTAMTAEQRASQAMSLLVYNMYTGPGASSQGDLFSGNPLNQFLQNELNKWSRNNLKGVDLSFGINSRDEADGSTHTDYSYKLSKKLFNDRIRIVIGGSYSPDDNSADALKQNLVEDIALEYFLDKRDNMLLKIFRHTGQESILEGEVTKTGVGFAVRKKLAKLSDLFRRSSKQQKTSTQTPKP
ncbi:MAG: translocation/assembly module TamB domain-containing protein [Coprobacter sp.]|nr:translocation/assembly module TamB domain-containing protein [Coprobacter sp.]